MRLKFYYLVVSLAFSLAGSYGQNLTEARRFADQLYNSGSHSLALAAYQRIAYFDRVNTDPGTLLRIAECFLAEGDLDHALEYFDHSYFAQADDSLKAEILLRKSVCYLKSHNYNFALIELLSLDQDPSTGYFSRLNFFMGMAWFGLEDFSKAQACFEKSAKNEDQAALIQAIFANRRNFDRPNPKTASWLSIFLPGAGQIYSGQSLDGLNSLLLTGSFVALALYLAVVSSPLDAILTALPWFQRYYQGGFKRAEEFAEQRRAENRSQTFDKILLALSSTGPLHP